jgi:hypothetical protein
MSKKRKDKEHSLKELKKVPGVGSRIAQDLLSLNIRSLSDLKGRNPERLYARLNKLAGRTNDPCVLYAFRCAVYFASSPRPKPGLLKWWAWKKPQKA